MTQPIVIAMLAKAGHGKDTVADHLVRTRKAAKRSFATPLKTMCGAIWGFTPAQLYGSQADKERIDLEGLGTSIMSPRTAMQRVGEAARAHLGKDVWIDACLRDIWASSQLPGGPQLFVISDARHLNEVQALKDFRLPTFVVKLVCEDAPPAQNPNHPSEAEVDLVDEALLDHVITWRREPRTNGLLEAFDAWFCGQFGDDT